MTDILKLYLHPNSTECIMFISPDTNLENLSLYQYIFIKYRNEETREVFHITYAWLSTTSAIFKGALQEAIANIIPLDTCIKNDIGYEYNKLYYTFAHNTSIDISSWVGNKYRAIDTNGNDLKSGTLWIYNDAEGKIVLEITPPFATLFFQAYPDEEPISFDEWMKNYKPLLVTTISKETAQHWVQQIDNLTKTTFEQMEKKK